MSDLVKRLIEAVEGGKATLSQVQDLCLPIWPNSRDHVLHVRIAIAYRDDDMTEALILLDGLLHSREWGRAPGGQMWVRPSDGLFVWSGDGFPSARGLLLAILRAYAGERASETTVR